MNLEIHKPELVQRVVTQLRVRNCHDVDELIEKALDALGDALDDAADEKSSPPPSKPGGTLHEFFMNSPLRGADLDLERARDVPRALDLE